MATITLKKPLVDKIERIAQEMNISPSRLLMLAVQDFIQRHQNQKLLDEINAAQEDDQPDEQEHIRNKQVLHQYRKLIEGEW